MIYNSFFISAILLMPVLYKILLSGTMLDCNFLRNRKNILFVLYGFCMGFMLSQYNMDFMKKIEKDRDSINDTLFIYIPALYFLRTLYKDNFSDLNYCYLLFINCGMIMGSISGYYLFRSTLNKYRPSIYFYKRRKEVSYVAFVIVFYTLIKLTCDTIKN